MIYQVEIKRSVGDRTIDGHTMCGWGRVDYEFYDVYRLACDRIAELRSEGVEASFGQLSRRVSDDR